MTESREEIELWRLETVIQKTGYSKPSIYRKMADGSFPKCVKLGDRAVAWRSDHIRSWCYSRMQA